MPDTQKITPCLWFAGQAMEAAEFYVSIFPDARIDHVIKTSVDTPGAGTGEVILVDFTLAGQTYQALNGGTNETFTNAISLSVSCQDQAEVDKYWEALTADGGAPIECGWLKDKYGVPWQIVPSNLPDMLRDPDPKRATRVMEALMQMVKFDIARLEAAYNQDD